MGLNFFNGLAHFVKGGVFFWYGILTLGRWAGCFAAVGWVSIASTHYRNVHSSFAGLEYQALQVK